MSLIVDPYQQHKFELNGVVYLLRALTSREKIGFMPYIIDGKELSHDVITSMVGLGLCGWEADAVEFDPNDVGINLDRIEFDDFIPILNKILALSGLDAEQEKN